MINKCEFDTNGKCSVVNYSGNPNNKCIEEDNNEVRCKILQNQLKIEELSNILSLSESNLRSTKESFYELINTIFASNSNCFLTEIDDILYIVVRITGDYMAWPIDSSDTDMYLSAIPRKKKGRIKILNIPTKSI